MKKTKKKNIKKKVKMKSKRGGFELYLYDSDNPISILPTPIKKEKIERFKTDFLEYNSNFTTNSNNNDIGESPNSRMNEVFDRIRRRRKKSRPIYPRDYVYIGLKMYQKNENNEINNLDDGIHNISFLRDTLLNVTSETRNLLDKFIYGKFKERLSLFSVTEDGISNDTYQLIYDNIKSDFLKYLFCLMPNDITSASPIFDLFSPENNWEYDYKEKRIFGRVFVEPNHNVIDCFNYIIDIWDSIKYNENYKNEILKIAKTNLFRDINYPFINDENEFEQNKYMILLEAIQNYKKFWEKDIRENRDNNSDNSDDIPESLKFAKINLSTLSKCEKIIEERLTDENGKFIFS